MKSIKFIISSILIFISFFIGYLLGQEKIKSNNNKIQNKKEYVDIEILKTKVKINSSNENIIISVNGNKTSSGSFELK